MEWVSLDPMDTPSGRRRKIVGLNVIYVISIVISYFRNRH